MTDVADTLVAQRDPVMLSFAHWQDSRDRQARRADAMRWGLSFLGVLAVTGGTVGGILRLASPPVTAPAPPPPLRAGPARHLPPRRAPFPGVAPPRPLPPAPGGAGGGRGVDPFPTGPGGWAWWGRRPGGARWRG
ncbi:hypothetical protein KTQ54_14080, partial [Komagataeibacter oboediens]|nr:hypothetical protein [Komagataeibacter oboediens]